MLAIERDRVIGRGRPEQSTSTIVMPRDLLSSVASRRAARRSNASLCIICAVARDVPLN